MKRYIYIVMFFKFNLYNASYVTW